MAVLALPLIVGATREALEQLPQRAARGVLRARQDSRDHDPRACCCPRSGRGSPAASVLGMGRIIGDTAIITVLLGGTPEARTASAGAPLLGTLRGTGSTLTSYVYYNSPAGEGNAPQKAYAAAFVLLMIVLALNAMVTRLSTGLSFAGRSTGRCNEWSATEPPPVRRIVVDRDPRVAAPPQHPRDGSGDGPPPPQPLPRRRGDARRDRRRRPPKERMRIESVWLAYGDELGGARRRACRCARARCWR